MLFLYPFVISLISQNLIFTPYLYILYFLVTFFYKNTYVSQITPTPLQIILMRFNILLRSPKTNFSFFKKNLKWRPLFKKSSYYMFYRTNKNRWLNK